MQPAIPTRREVVLDTSGKRGGRLSSSSPSDSLAERRSGPICRHALLSLARLHRRGRSNRAPGPAIISTSTTGRCTRQSPPMRSSSFTATFSVESCWEHRRRARCRAELTCRRRPIARRDSTIGANIPRPEMKSDRAPCALEAIVAKRRDSPYSATNRASAST
jgi:hypothetical protein